MLNFNTSCTLLNVVTYMFVFRRQKINLIASLFCSRSPASMISLPSYAWGAGGDNNWSKKVIKGSRERDKAGAR